MQTQIAPLLSHNPTRAGTTALSFHSNPLDTEQPTAPRRRQHETKGSQSCEVGAWVFWAARTQSPRSRYIPGAFPMHSRYIPGAVPAHPRGQSRAVPLHHPVSLDQQRHLLHAAQHGRGVGARAQQTHQVGERHHLHCKANTASHTPLTPHLHPREPGFSVFTG